jgi:nucleoside-diphosphate-sugar epimerase
MVSDGSPWRPVVHVDDICDAIYRALIAPESAVSGKIFNVGQNSDNYRIREIAQIIAEEFPGCTLSVGPASADTRSYRVNFDRIHRELPGFKCRYSARDGARQLRQIFERIQMQSETYQFRAFTRLKQLQYLQATKQVDSAFYWTEQ